MKKVWIFLWVVVLVGCKENTKKIAVVGQTEIAAAKPEVKLYVLDGGTVMVNQLELFAQDESYKGQSREFADAYYVVSHPEGNLMWDAGLPESLVAMGEPYTSPEGAFTVSRKDSLHHQLAEIGMSVDDMDYISLSHTHFDHVGHARELKNATWLVQEKEYNWVTGDTIKNSNPEIYEAIKDLQNIEKIDGDHDVFGDGTVVLKLMPGHTPGHQVLYLDLKEHGPLLLSGDLYHLSENREFKRIPIFNYDVAQTRESMNEFEAFAEEKKAKVYLQHSKSDFDRMPKAPEYLK